MKGKYYTHVEPKLLLVEGWARDGLIDEQIAKNLGISYASFKTYKAQHLPFLAVLQRGKEVVDTEVENALLKRALGYEYEEVTVEFGVEAKRVKKIQPPDVTAQIFWLKNRRPPQWRDRKEVDLDIGMKDKLEDLLE